MKQPRVRHRTLALYGQRLRRRPVALVGSAVFLFFFLMALIGPLVAPYDFQAQAGADRLQGPSVQHFFGTDQYGRDIFSRVLVGSRGIFLLGGTATLLAVIVGTAIGLLSGYMGGFFDEAVMRLLDVFLSIPSLLLALVLLSTLGPSMLNLVAVVTVLYVPMIARVVRSMVLDLKTKEFVEAAKVRGESALYIMFREILPNAMPPLVVETAARFSYSIFLIASLGFLGLGVQPPSPNWGLMVAEARDSYALAPWMLLFPAGAISLLIVGVSLLSDGLRRLLQPGITGDGS